MQTTIVSTQWLHDHLNDTNLIVLDASTQTNISGKTSEYDGKHIPNARYFDLKNHFSDPQATFPNTLPNPKTFETEVRKLGVSNESQIVVYDNLGIYNSPRVWWMFQTMGHKNIAVLDGGLPAWANAGFEIADHLAKPLQPGNFTAQFDENQVKTYAEVLANIDLKNFTVIDARSKGRFDGTAPEPRQGMSSGHIPNSCNLPFEQVLSNGHFKSKEELKSLFSDLQTEDSPLVFSCGSGLTACIILLAAELVLNNQKAVFDGSWTEWASIEGSPIKKNS